MESDWEAEIALAAIAQELLDLKTLHPRGSEWQDTHDYHVTEIKAALVAAYNAGQDSICKPALDARPQCTTLTNIGQSARTQTNNAERQRSQR